MLLFLKREHIYFFSSHNNSILLKSQASGREVRDGGEVTAGTQQPAQVG